MTAHFVSTVHQLIWQTPCCAYCKVKNFKQNKTKSDLSNRISLRRFINNDLPTDHLYLY